MKVNCKKTQLLLISPPNSYDSSAYISLCGERVESGRSLKLLGFTFGNEPNVNAHYDSIKQKFRKRFWALIHLKNAGFTGDQIMTLFNVYIRLVIEYCCVVYYPLLTAAQTEGLERMQKQAARLAYGWNLFYAELCEEKGITCLLYTSPSPRDLSTSRMPSSA